MVNITGLQNGSVSSFYKLVQYNNTVTNNLFSDTLLVALTIIIFVQTLKRSEPKIAYMVTSFVMLILSLLFVSINLATPIFVWIFALLLIFSVIYNYATK